MIDDAHATGVFGQHGKGMIEHYGLEGKVDIIMGSLSKAIGSIGGFIAGNKCLIDFLKNKARSFVYTTALPPAACAASLAGLILIQEDTTPIDKLWDNIRYLRSQLSKFISNISGESPIVPIIIGSAEDALRISKRLYEKGILIPAIRPPTVPLGTSRLRISLMATHSKEDINRLIDTMKDIGFFLTHGNTILPRQAMHRPTWVEIDLNALRHNLLAIKKRVGPQINILGIVKADAYGHGDYEVSRVLLSNGVEMLGIAIVEEGIQLREKGIKTPLLILGGIFEEQIDTVIQYDLTPTVYDLKLADVLSKRAYHFNKVIKVHVYVDTGMGSIGVKHNKAVEFIKSLKEMKNLLIEGIYTHCSSSDENDSSFTNLQIKDLEPYLMHWIRSRYVFH